MSAHGPLGRFYGNSGMFIAVTSFWLAIHWRERDNCMKEARGMQDGEARRLMASNARERNRQVVRALRELRRAFAEQRGEDRMPEGARRSKCPACSWTFGTHAPDCDLQQHGKFT